MTNEFKYYRFCASMGIVFMGVFIFFWGIAGFNLPPYSASTDASVIAATYRENANLVRSGMVIAMTVAVLYAVWGLGVAKIVERTERHNNILSTLAMWGAGLTVVPLLVTPSFWLAAAYRPDALPDYMIQFLYDEAWLLIDLAYSVTTVQMIACGIGFLQDKREKPLIPRWVAWFGIWAGISFAIEILMPLFKNGPFERAGVINFWVEFLLWFIWVPTLSFYLLRAVGRLEAEAKTEKATANPAPFGRLAAAE